MHDHKYDIEKYKDKPCECCGKEHDHTYGSGRFCSEECKLEYIAETKRGAHNPKVKVHLDKLRREGKIAVKAPRGTWKCVECHLIFETKSQMKEHFRAEHQTNLLVNKGTMKQFACPYCGAEFDTNYQIGGHIINCPSHPNKDFHDEVHKGQGKALKQKYKSGELINPWKGKHHSKRTRQKMREAACRYLMSINPTPCRYNKSSIPILESIAKDHGWNIQHAENGGEFYTGIGYFVDAYDKEKNVVLEYDEPKHYEDVDNNVLTEKDKERQQQIIEHLHCEYWRYNEATKTLWKVI